MTPPYVLAEIPPPADALRRRLREHTRADEAAVVAEILVAAALPSDARSRIEATARRLVVAVRAARVGKGGIDALLHEYALSSREGVALMCLAEALLRIPDAATVDRLIEDKIAGADWQRHLGHSESLFVNASTWALMLTGRVVTPSRGGDFGNALRRFLRRSGEPVVRQAVTAAMRILGRQFVMGRTIGEALDRAAADEDRGYRHSYDMLGEAARTAADAERYLASYEAAIAAIGAAAKGRDIAAAPGISVKLSALHPRYEEAQRARVMAELAPHLKSLALQAKTVGIGFTIDAEESERLDLSLDLLAGIAGDPELAGWHGLGLAVQAYQKRALPLLDWLADLARRSGRRLMVRLVKGAYWDSEIKRGQERGLAGYPVFTRKVATDVSYVACAKRLLASPEAFFPQFATHNAQTLATILELAGPDGDYEFQRLHGMGEALYDEIVGTDRLNRPCRIYAPVGSHEDLLAYLVRRLLENGANTSFVNRIVDEQAPVEQIVADPVARLRGLEPKPHPRIALPEALFGKERRNSSGLDLADPLSLADLAAALAAAPQRWTAAPIVDGSEFPGPPGSELPGQSRDLFDPADRRRCIGSVVEAAPAQIEAALAGAVRAAASWDATSPDARAAALDRAADLFTRERAAFVALLVREGGRCLPDAISEIREAVDYCRYYAARARADFALRPLPGPTGERNAIVLHGRGVFACIAPWNFPLAIFTGQIVAALVAGNAVIAKPAEQTPFVGAAAVRLLHRAGIPANVLHFLPGDGTVGAALVAGERIAGVAFTGSTATAQAINRTLAARQGPIVPFIAETGGQNAMIVDSSALPEQVVADVLASAFDSAGQRCSSLRILCLQQDIADRIVTMLIGAMRELTIGDPGLLATDIGPVIDQESRQALATHVARMAREAKILFECKLPPAAAHGTFFAPRLIEIDRIAQLTGEVFGPVLHVLRWHGDHLPALLDAIDATGFGLTLGIHSRIDATVAAIRNRMRIGNVYVNRNMIGAVVGSQPFGGEGLSGTGPKAGGRHYLPRFAVERTVSIDTTAAGGNAGLLSLDDS